MKKQTLNIELGDFVKDAVTKIQGIVVCEEISLHRCKQYHVAEEKKGDSAKIYKFDEGQLEIIQKGKIKRKIAEDEKVIALGDMVEDIITGFKGVATVRERHLFRCDRILAQPVADKDNKIGDGYTFDAQSLKVTKKNYVKMDETSEPQKATGCRMERRPHN